MSRKLAIKIDENGVRYSTTNWTPTDSDIVGFVEDGEKVKQEIDLLKDKLKRVENEKVKILGRFDKHELETMYLKIENVQTNFILADDASEQMDHWTILQQKFFKFQLESWMLQNKIEKIEKR